MVIFGHVAAAALAVVARPTGDSDVVHLDCGSVRGSVDGSTFSAKASRSVPVEMSTVLHSPLQHAPPAPPSAHRRPRAR